MNAKTIISCNCGQRVISKDVIQKGQYLRLFGPSFIYVKFRCSRCKRLGEKFIEQDKWDESVLRDVPCEYNPDERKKFEDLGPISINEVIDFHHRLSLFDFNRLESTDLDLHDSVSEAIPQGDESDSGPHLEKK